MVTLVSRTCMTVTIITESVMAQRRAGVIWKSFMAVAWPAPRRRG